MNICKIASIFDRPNDGFSARTLKIKRLGVMYYYIDLCKNTSEVPIQYFLIFLEIVA